MQSKDQVLRKYATVLSMLLRKRQACAHIELLPKDKDNQGISKDDERMRKLLEQNIGDCSICSKMPRDACITKCEHIFCHACLTEEIQSVKEYKCPMCEETIREKDVKRESDLEDRGSSGVVKRHGKRMKVPDDIKPSSKIKRVIEEIQKPYKDTNEIPKCVLFSQWTSFLDIIQKCLDQQNIKYTRLDGSMNRKQRNAQLHLFKTEPHYKVLLMSLKAGAL
eukprot:UN29331